MQDNVVCQAMAYVISKPGVLLDHLLQQLYLVFTSSLLTVTIGIFLAVCSYRLVWMRRIILKIASTLYTIPILAMFGLLISLVGIGNTPALIALVVYGILPILHNTYEGILGVDSGVREAAKGMGANWWQLLVQVELPLALPKIIAGIRTSIIMNISVSTFAVFIGAGGLGSIIIQGMRTFHNGMLLAGTTIVALIAICTERILHKIELATFKSINGYEIMK